ncbi:MAG TPA: hypothetical protein DC048_05290 [Planctomycetaceae bacterium]|nr:hypothetical protein [Planctomycetaceae bacterium]
MVALRRFFLRRFCLRLGVFLRGVILGARIVPLVRFGLRIDAGRDGGYGHYGVFNHRDFFWHRWLAEVDDLAVDEHA